MTDLIDGYLAHLREASSADSTIEMRRETLRRIHRELPLGIEAACADELRTWLWRDNLSQGSRETYYSAINGFFTWAYDHEHIDFNPAEQLIRPKSPERLPRPITDDELRILLGCAQPYQLWVKLAAYGGLRCIDISRLHREHMTEEQVMLHRSKGSKPRPVPMHPVVWEAVKDLPRGPITIHDRKFISIRSAVYFQRTLKMPGVTLHRCRHWFGTNVQRRYKNLLVTSNLMGHKNPKSTAGYAAITSDENVAAISLLPSFATDDDDQAPGKMSSR